MLFYIITNSLVILDPSVNLSDFKAKLEEVRVIIFRLF